MAQGGALLLGRRTYEDLYAVWPNRKDTRHTQSPSTKSGRRSGVSLGPGRRFGVRREPPRR
jgi:hypothetical protein